jgi:hypothetical protein
MPAAHAMAALERSRAKTHSPAELVAQPVTGRRFLDSLLAALRLF